MPVFRCRLVLKPEIKEIRCILCIIIMSSSVISIIFCPVGAGSCCRPGLAPLKAKPSPHQSLFPSVWTVLPQHAALFMLHLCSERKKRTENFKDLKSCKHCCLSSLFFHSEIRILSKLSVLIRLWFRIHRSFSIRSFFRPSSTFSDRADQHGVVSLLLKHLATGDTFETELFLEQLTQLDSHRRTVLTRESLISDKRRINADRAFRRLQDSWGSHRFFSLYLWVSLSVLVMQHELGPPFMT